MPFNTLHHTHHNENMRPNPVNHFRAFVSTLRRNRYNPFLSTAALPRIPGLFFLQILQERRSLIAQLVKRDFTQRFVGSAAGWLWTLIHPLVLLLSWIFVFQWCLRIPPPAGAGDSYTLYLFFGYLPWLLFQESVQRSANCLNEQANLITKTVFPSEILPVSIFLSSLISHGIGLLIAILADYFVHRHVSTLIVFLPLYAFCLGLLAVGAGWIVSSLQVYLRDTAQAVVVLLTAMFWLTPIFIDESQFPPEARFLVHWNPLAAVVRGYRAVLLQNDLPNLRDLAFLFLVSAVVFVAGGLFFRHLKRGFADVL